MNNGLLRGFTWRTSIAPGKSYPDLERWYFDGTDLLLTPEHVNKVVTTRSSSPVTIRVPPMQIRPGECIFFKRKGTGAVTLVEQPGARIEGAFPGFVLRAQNSTCGLMLEGSQSSPTCVWNLFGDISGDLTDPCFNEVILLLHGDGADNSTTITDSSSRNRAASVFGNARIRTANFKYGSSAIYFDGVGDYLSYADSNDWDFAGLDYTWEFWACPDDTTAAASRRIFGQGNALGGEIPVDVSLTTSGKWQAARWNGVSQTPNYVLIGGDSFPAAQCAAGRWDHVALVFKYVATPVALQTCYLFVNGVLVDQINAQNPQSVNTSMSIGRVGGFDGQYFKGYLDEIRFTQGCARYTSNFTPPAAPFPNE